MEKEKTEKQEEIKFIKEVKIDKLWNDKDFNLHWKLNSDVNILAGDNGVGKSTVLQLIEGILFSFFEKKILQNIIYNIEIKFNDKKALKYTHINNWLNIYNERLDNLKKQSRKRTSIRIKTRMASLLKVKDFLEYHKNRNEDIYMLSNISNTIKPLSTIDYSILSLIGIYKVSSVDNLLIEREAIQKLSNDRVVTELDWKIYQLEEQYKDYQINVSKRVIKAFKNGQGYENVNAKQPLFYDLIDQLFAHTKKTIDRDSNDILFRDKENKKITPYRLSSGEKHMIIMLLTALVQDNKHAIMIMDEPEISLHTDWQEDLITNIRKLNPNVQLIIATHSPSIVINGWQDKIFEIDDLIVKSEENKIEEVNQESN